MAGHSDFKIKYAKLMFTSAARISLYRQISRLLVNKLPLPSILETLWQRKSNFGAKKDSPVAIVLSEWRIGINSGKSLGESINGWVPQGERMLIEAGESSGKLVEAFDDAIKITQGTKAVKAALVSGLAYPIILGATIIAVLWGFGTQIIPAFAQILPPERWTGIAGHMATMSDITKVWTFPVIILFIASIIAYFISAPRWKGRVRAKFDNIPPWSMYRMWQGLSFLLSLSSLLSAGVKTSDILEKTRRDANPYVKYRIDQAIHYYKSGVNIGDAFRKTGLGFPDPDIIEDMCVFAPLTGFEDSLKIMAYDWLKNSVDKVNQQAKSLNTILLLVFFAIIMFMGTGFYAVQQQVVKAAQDASG